MKEPKKTKSFTSVPNSLFDADFNANEIFIISMILSWQRQGKIFHEGKDKIADKLSITRTYVRKLFDRLESLRILEKGKQVKGRSYEYTVNEDEIRRYTVEYLYRSAKEAQEKERRGNEVTRSKSEAPGHPVTRTWSPDDQDSESQGYGMTRTWSPDDHYQNTKTIPKNSLRISEEMDTSFVDVSSFGQVGVKEEVKKPIPEGEELQTFLDELDI